MFGLISHRSKTFHGVAKYSNASLGQKKKKFLTVARQRYCMSMRVLPANISLCIIGSEQPQHIIPIMYCLLSDVPVQVLSCCEDSAKLRRHDGDLLTLH